MRLRGRARLLLATATVWALSLPAAGEATVKMATVKMVIDTCERALATGYGDMDAAMCDWHVRPCGVCGGIVSTVWCVPPTVTAEALATEVVVQLKRRANLALPAKLQVERILRAHYPCAAQDGPRD